MKENKVKQRYKQVKKTPEQAQPESLGSEALQIQCKSSGLLLRETVLYYRATPLCNALLSFMGNSFSSASSKNQIVGFRAHEDG